MRSDLDKSLQALHEISQLPSDAAPEACAEAIKDKLKELTDHKSKLVKWIKLSKKYLYESYPQLEKIISSSSSLPNIVKAYTLKFPMYMSKACTDRCSKLFQQLNFMFIIPSYYKCCTSKAFQNPSN